jgi:hypothetical protein
MPIVYSLKVLIFIVIFFSLYAVMTIGSLQSTYGESPRLSNVEVVGTSNKNNITILNASTLASNTSISNPVVLPSVSIENLSQTPMTTDLSNSIGVEDFKGARFNSTEGNRTAEKLNLTSLASSNQFSLGNLLNMTSDNSSSVNDTVYDTSTTFKLTLDPPSSFDIPIESVVKRSGFQGISILNAGVGSRSPDQKPGPLNPPDPTIAVSRDHIGEFVNVAGAFFNKEGELLSNSPFNLTNFFSAPSKHFLTDPKIIYDNSTRKWFAIVLDGTDNTVRLAVSSDPDPIKARWKVLAIPFGGKCPDQPSLGLSKDKLIIVANVMDSCLSIGDKLGQFIIFDKYDLLNGVNPPRKYSSGLYANFTNLRVARMTNSNDTSDLHLVRFNTTEKSNIEANAIYVITISEKVPHIKLESSIHPIQNAIKTFSQLSQRGGEESKFVPPAPKIETDFLSVEDAYWHDGKMWLTGSVLCSVKGESHLRQCIRLIQVDTRNNTKMQDFNTDYPGKDLFLPALAVNSEGDLGIIFGYSSKDDYPGLLAATQSSTASKHTLDSLVTLLPSIAFSNDKRLGDYFGIVVDPFQPKKFWAVGQFIPLSPMNQIGTQPFWSTFIADFTSPQTPSLPPAEIANMR